MLTVRKMAVVAGDQEEALAEVGDVLEPSLPSRGFVRPGSRAAARANSMWLGSSAALERLGLERGAETIARQLALVLQGRHAITGKQVLQPRNGAIRSFELTFWAPESVARVWYKADDRLRARIEHAVIVAVGYSLAYLTQQGGEPSAEFAASVTLRVRTRTHPEAQGCRGRCRAVLADKLRELGFQIEAMTGPGGRYFEIAGVPEGMLRSDVWTHAECARSA